MYIALEGFFYQVEVESNTGKPVPFHFNVDNINSLRKAVIPM